MKQDPDFWYPVLVILCAGVFSAIGLLGCYGDLAPNTKDLPAKKVATIAAYNAQGWEYPSLMCRVLPLSSAP